MTSENKDVMISIAPEGNNKTSCSVINYTLLSVGRTQNLNREQGNDFMKENLLTFALQEMEMYFCLLY